ncbi:complement factor B-like [Phyllobates terribilis]|uniref:complement factor B-like n=1 Tax=Phyllobates terribilis TaxID=111132 RepID=UPI003CCAEB91
MSEDRDKMLPLILLSHIALCIATSTPKCDLKKITITGGNHSLTDGVNVGSTVEYSCPEGMYPHPSRSRDCLYTGQWSDEKVKAQCRAVQCPRPSMIESGKFYPAKARYFVGDVLRFECFGGSEIFGPENRTCQANGKWSGVNTKCDNHESDCPNPGVPIGATKLGFSYKVGDKVTYECEPWLQMFGSKERVCMKNKRWSGAEPSCRYWYTFDTPEEVTETFFASLSELIELSSMDYTPDTAGHIIGVRKESLMNIFIFIDASKSVGLKNFNTAKTISEVFIEKMSQLDITPRYSIISYASFPRPIVRFYDDDSTDADAVIEKIKSFQYTEHEDEQGTNIRGALYEVHKLFLQEFARDPKKFQEKRNVVLLMTEGKHNISEDLTPELRNIREILDQHWDHFLDVFVFGLGDNISDDEINELASKKDQENHVFKMRSVDDMKAAFDEILDEAEILPLCGFSKDPSQDEEEVEGVFPWIAKITITHPASVRYCKGSIVSKRFILSAAHCFLVNEDVQNINVQVGDQVLGVRNLHRHREYRITRKKDNPEEKTFDSDLALIELDKKIVFTRKIRPICLPCTSGASWALRQRGKSVTCSDHEKMLLSSELVRAMFVAEEKSKAFERKDVFIKRGSKRLACIDDTKKIEKFKDILNIKEVVSDNFLCTGGTEPQVDPQTCNGDGGGPLIVPYRNRYVQVGVISWGTVNSCTGQKRNPGPVLALSRDFHTDLFKMMDWLKEELKDEVEFLN